MESTKYHVLGIMSGTSHDGIDIADIHLEIKEKSWNYHIGATATYPYPDYWQKQLAGMHRLSREKATSFNKEYTDYLAEQINRFLKEFSPDSIDAICSHGHTIFHKPEEGYTLQIGNLPELAQLTGHTVVCDFRVQDVKLGGQGAPLVPIGDRLLFSNYDACINLGGFANISIEKDHERLAYDICAVNTVLNRYSKKLGQTFDKDGLIARGNSPDSHLENKLNQLSFYKEAPPKSLGIEWVEEVIFPILEASGLSPEKIIATYTHHVARQLAQSLNSLAAKSALMTGGGVFNKFLIELTQEKTECQLIIPDSKLVEYKEALIFGLLGVLKLRDEINVLKSVTGAKKDHSSGIIYHP